ncbi:Malate dehydrogenase, cytoplasmic [Habropoda laboriosa]|uniref:Malate dehydrogenase, cytoplasmic n=1 Tax=Habropoda laboriosa TaxID=597456 RepID=A0A0L7RGJ3_9HYME|nr:Malate dehydrogenase, cytoplasmic [Habropoda laboriosa]
MMKVLEGVVMELQDLALSLLREVVPTADPAVAFKDVAAAFLVGAMPRKEGMERKDLLAANVEIFKVQGEALDKYARKDVKILVVGNPANTNALICSHYAPSIPKENFTALINNIIFVGLPISDFARSKLNVTSNELEEERAEAYKVLQKK